MFSSLFRILYNKRVAALVATIIACGCLPGANAEPSKKLLGTPGYAEAASALNDKQYDIAAMRFADLLTSPESANFTTPDEQWIMTQMAMAHVRAGQPNAALKTLKDLKESAETKFWRAQAHVQLGQFASAERLLKKLLKEPQPIHKDACHFTRARVLTALERLPEAVEELKSATQSSDETTSARAQVALAETLFRLGRLEEVEQMFDKSIREPYQSQLRYIIGLVSLDQRIYPKAIRVFKEVLASLENLTGSSTNLVVSSEIGLAAAQAGNGQQEKAIQQLIATIDGIEDGPMLYEAFATLEALDLLSSPAIAERLKVWTKVGDPGKAAIARYYAIVTDEMSGQQTDALSRYLAFAVEHPDHPLLPQALLRQAVLLARSAGQEGQNKALKVLAELQNYRIPPTTEELVHFLNAKAEFAIASASANTGDDALATERFRKAEAAFLAAAEASDTDTAAIAYYDAAIAAMRANVRENISKYLSVLDQTPEVKGDLLLERGLYLASLGSNQHFRDAQVTLETFVSFNPNHSRAFAAHLAIAEIAMIKLPQAIRTALRHLETAERQPELSNIQKQQLDYTRFRLEESRQDSETNAMVALGNRFLQEWPESLWRDEVQMKLGEHYFRTENYPLALRMFENLEKESPDSELADAALFFAGKANMRLDPSQGPERAITLWNRVVRNGGQLSIPARYQQALARRRQLEFDQAAEILNSLLENDSVTGEERKAVLCSLGETLFSQSRTDPDKLNDAEELFEKVVALSDDSPAWRNQALYRLAKCHERAGNLLEAKNAYYEVFDTKTTPVPDYTWFYRAGSQLVELLKEEKKWDAAITVATKLADSQGSRKGPRASEFEKKAELLKLEHFRR